jgi:hypothetical protein
VVPEWAPAHARGAVRLCEGVTNEAYLAVQKHRDSILTLLHTTVEEYLRHMTFENGFPDCDRLTGEYYIGSESYCVASDPCRDPISQIVLVPCYRVNFGVRCLQWPRPPHVPEFDDYLGLDIDIRCDPAHWRLFVFACDSSSI